jgi:hypothetical protein
VPAVRDSFFCACHCRTPVAREKTDIIVMNNGGRLTGEIKGLDSGTLSVSFDYILGTASLDWSKVDHLESKQLFLVGGGSTARSLRSFPIPEATGDAIQSRRLARISQRTMGGRR